MFALNTAAIPEAFTRLAVTGFRWIEVETWDIASAFSWHIGLIGCVRVRHRLHHSIAGF
jgi:hypothetical protein